jgi:cysteine-rich repeat protein
MHTTVADHHTHLARARIILSAALLMALSVTGCSDDAGGDTNPGADTQTTSGADATATTTDTQATSGADTDPTADADPTSDDARDTSTDQQETTIEDIPVAMCGDGRIFGGEACDDGNAAAGDGCSDACQVEAGWQCRYEGQACSLCGDGQITGGEACDDGNAVGGDGCSSECNQERHFTCFTPGEACAPCGDGVIQPGEACDDGNVVGGDGCSEACLEVGEGFACPSPGIACVATRCGDGLLAGAESCDDGNRLSGDGCDFFCRAEDGFVCDTPGVPCRLTACGDGLVEGAEACDDSGQVSGDGCSDACQIEVGFACPPAGGACTTTTCGDGVVQGIETCDDSNADSGDGCSATCLTERGFACPTPGSACEATTCGDGLIEGVEACDDGDADSGDGCSDLCEVEVLFACEGQPSVCHRVLEFVSISRFAAPAPQNQAVHYDPVSRSFVVYDFSSGDGVEFCLDGTVVGSRPRPVGGTLDGATYDPFTDRFLFVQQNNTLSEVDRSGAVVRQVTLEGINFAGGIAVGDNGHLYVSGQADKRIHIYERMETTPRASILSDTQQAWFDQMIAISGLRLIGAHYRPQGSTDYQVTLFDLDGQQVARSTIPGPLFLSGVGDFAGNSDGAEAAVDGGAFMICSEYNGFCEIFSRACRNHAECAARVPQTACKLDAPIPYCYAPASARDDSYAVDANSADNALEVGRNDLSSIAACTGTQPTLVSVSDGSLGGTITIAPDGVQLLYSPAPGVCGVTETFTYTTDLGGDAPEEANVNVSITCLCGDGFIGGAEACDDANTDSGDGCSSGCVVEPNYVCTGTPSECIRIN